MPVWVLAEGSHAGHERHRWRCLIPQGSFSMGAHPSCCLRSAAQPRSSGSMPSPGPASRVGVQLEWRHCTATSVPTRMPWVWRLTHRYTCLIPQSSGCCQSAPQLASAHACRARNSQQTSTYTSSFECRNLIHCSSIRCSECFYGLFMGSSRCKSSGREPPAEPLDVCGVAR